MKVSEVIKKLQAMQQEAIFCAYINGHLIEITELHSGDSSYTPSDKSKPTQEEAPIVYPY
jgi:hypothetical protein